MNLLHAVQSEQQILLRSVRQPDKQLSKMYPAEATPLPGIHLKVVPAKEYR
jgi:hypothetical protein